MMSRWQFAWVPVLWTLGATGPVVALMGFSRDSSAIASAPPQGIVAMDSGPCYHYWTEYFAGLYNHKDFRLSLAGSQTDVPEYNDCQRLLENPSRSFKPAYTNLKFGNIAAIFARADLNNVYRHETPIGNVTGKPFFAALKRPNLATTRVTAIAQVWTKGPYKPLGLRTGFACVVLQWERPVASRDPRNYHAWMVPVANQELCASPLDLPAKSAFYLGAQEFPASSNGSVRDEIPPVARWDWDGQRGEQYVGIACPTGWCELYGENPSRPHGHHSSPVYEVPKGLSISGQEGQVVRQKGWYDEEYLASTTVASGAVPKLDGAFGTVFPVPHLKDRNKGDYTLGHFIPVAWISISPDSKGYFGKYGFRGNKAPPESPNVNALFLCFDDGTNKCKASPKHHCSPTRDHPSGLRFYARLGKSFDDVKGTDFCVDFISTPSDVRTPGTVRWRWLDNDQTIWVSCPSGCCQIAPPK